MGHTAPPKKVFEVPQEIHQESEMLLEVTREEKQGHALIDMDDTVPRPRKEARRQEAKQGTKLIAEEPSNIIMPRRLEEAACDTVPPKSVSVDLIGCQVTPAQKCESSNYGSQRGGGGACEYYKIWKWVVDNEAEFFLVDKAEAKKGKTP